MVSAFKVALVGFAQSESATFESFFRLAARRLPAYVVQDEVMDAELLVVNADNAQALHLVRFAELEGKILLIGLNDGGTGWPLQRKPIKLVSVLTAMDELMGVRLHRRSPCCKVAIGVSLPPNGLTVERLPCWLRPGRRVAKQIQSFHPLDQ